MQTGKTDAEVRELLLTNRSAFGWEISADAMADVVAEVRGAVNLTIVSSVSNEAPAWPEPPASEAFHGLAGEVVAAIEPHTEADPVGVLAQFLTIAGCQFQMSGHRS